MEVSHLDENDKLWVEKIIPGYNPLMSLRELMSSVTPYGASLLKDEKQVTELRKYIGEYMDRETYSFEKWGKNFNEKFKETSIGKSFTEMIESLLPENDKDNFNVKFSHAYTLLELYNITQERTKKGLKKFNLTSLSTDASHAYFGSFCDYLVSDDKGMQVKANIVYQLFGFKTKVLSSEDFINISHILLGQEEVYEKFSTSFQYDLKHAFLLNRTFNIENGLEISTYQTTHSYFNYFNRFQIIVDKGYHTYAFYADRENHGSFFMYRELEILVRKLLTVFGLDDDAKGIYSFDENNTWQVGDVIRKWTRGELLFCLTTSTRTWGNFIVLTLEMI